MWWDGYQPIRTGEYLLTGIRWDKKLLLHKREIAASTPAPHARGVTLIPLSVYLLGNYAKMEVWASARARNCMTSGNLQAAGR